MSLPQLPLPKTSSSSASQSSRCDLESLNTTDAEKPVGQDPDTVDWNGPTDPENPMNWSATKKLTSIGIISFITLLSPLASTIIAPATPEVMETFHATNQTLGAFVTSVYLLGYAFGPLVIAPLSELYGRAIVYHVCNFIFLIFSIACALSNSMGALIAFRLLEGIGASCPVTLGAGSIADMFAIDKRGKAMAGWLLGTLIGPVFGPLIGAYLAQAKGWRWIFWLVSILAGAVFLITLLFMQESLAYVILKRKTERLVNQTGNTRLRSALDSGKDPNELFQTAIIRPLKMLFFSPIVPILSLYMASIYSDLYLLFTTFPRVFQGQYGFSDGSVGLVYLGTGVGTVLAVILFGSVGDRIWQSLTRRNGGAPKPEYRLPLVFIGAFTIPIGLFLYAWSAETRLHWIVPVIGTSFLGFGMLVIFLPCTTYLVDVFTIYAASASAAATVSRSVLGALLPLAGNTGDDKPVSESGINERLQRSENVLTGPNGVPARAFVQLPINVSSVITPQSERPGSAGGVTSEVERLENDVAWLSSIYTEQNIAGKVPFNKIVFRTCPIQQITESRVASCPASTSAAPWHEFVRCIWLPEFHEAQALLDVFLRDICQHPHVIHVPSLPKVFEKVFADLAQHQQVNPGQLLLVLSIFVGATRSWTTNDCTDGLFASPSDAHNQTATWVKAFEDILDVVYRSSSLSIEAVQGTLITSFVLSDIEGLYRRCRALYSQTIPMARELGLHRIDHPSNAAPKNTIQAEMGRRVWWYICSSDWALASRVTGSIEGTYSCHPRQMMTRKPLHIDEEDVFDGMSGNEKPLTQPTTMSYSLQRIRLSELSRRAVDRLPLFMSSMDSSSNYDLMDIDTELETFTTEIPSFFSMTSSQLIGQYGLSPSRAADIVHHGHALRFLIYTQRCKFHLPFLSRGFVDPEYTWSREVCVRMSRLIIQAEEKLDNSQMCIASHFSLGGLLLGVFMASIVLLMDLCMNKSNPQSEGQRKEVAKAFRILDDAKNESETIAKFVDSLTFILRRRGIAPLRQPASKLPPNNPVIDDGVDAQASHPPVQAPTPDTSSGSLHGIGIGDGTWLGQQHNPLLDDPQYTLSYFGDLAQNFEQGIGIDEFEWGNVFSDLDTALL